MSNPTKATALVYTLGIVIFALGFTVVSLILIPKGRPTCRSFGSYADIVSAFKHGAQWLDKDGDGIPCEQYR